MQSGQKTIRKPWITQDMLEKWDKQRKQNINTVEYRKLNNELRRETERGKEKLVNKMCDEITKSQ